jgi:hypothetical protein
MSILTHRATASLPLRAAMALDLDTVTELARLHGNNVIGQAAGAWLGTYRAAMLLGFGEVVARQQAAYAWDAVQDDGVGPIGDAGALSANADTGITPAGSSWLRAYQVARGLGFSEDVAQAQAFRAAAWALP